LEIILNRWRSIAAIQALLSKLPAVEFSPDVKFWLSCQQSSCELWVLKALENYFGGMFPAELGIGAKI
jgi:hypothetical protein